MELELRRVKTCHLSSVKTALIPELEVKMSFAMVLAKYRQQKRPRKSRKTTKKEYSKRKKSENSTPQKNQKRNQDSTKPKYKTYKNAKSRIKKVQYNHRKLRGKKEEYNEDRKTNRTVLNAPDNKMFISDQKSRNMSNVNMCIFDGCNATPVFSWQKTNVLVKHLVVFHELEHEAAREAAMKYQVESKASSEVIRRLKHCKIVWS